MLIKGTFDEERRPYVQGLLFIPKSRISGAIDFLVDTGSDCTTLNPGDGRRLNIDYKSLRFCSPAFGIGSEHETAEVPAFVGFATVEKQIVLYSIELSISPYDKNLEILPSMLGTDILHRWKIAWDSTINKLEFEIISYDSIESI